MAKVVPIDPIAEPPGPDEARFDSDCDRALARARESRQPHGRAALPEKALAVRPRDGTLVPGGVGGPALHAQPSGKRESAAGTASETPIRYRPFGPPAWKKPR